MKDKPKQITFSWQSMASAEVLSALSVGEAGLSQAEAEIRLQKYGTNQLTVTTGRGLLKRFLRQFNNVLIYLLLSAAVITYVIGEKIDSFVILAVVLINAFIGFIQEGKAEIALLSIRNLLTLEATVLRDGIVSNIKAEGLVPGDIVHLESGDKVPADLRLLTTKSLRIDESMLTGESVPVEKHTKPLSTTAVLGDRFNMAYSGTLVTYGTGVGVVVATADNTELGRINKLLGTVPPLVTPLLRQIAKFSQWLSISILAIATATFIYGWRIQHSSLTDLFMSVVSLAIAAIPEGLPAIMTITLAIGVQQMAKRNAIVRRLPAVETLGSVTVICTDKTGTLTCNEMTVKSVIAANKLYLVEGVGYSPQSEAIRLNGVAISVDKHQELERLVQAAALCNNANVLRQSAVWVNQGDPTEAALITLALKANVDLIALRRTYPRLDIIPFESAHSLMATLHAYSDNRLVYVKGAPERILLRCNFRLERGLNIPLDRESLQQQIQQLAERGQRVIAVAFKELPKTQVQLGLDDIESGLVLLGIIGMMDPPRAESASAVQRCQQAGIRIKMVTGDHAITARTIAEQMGIGNASVLCGEDIDGIDDMNFNSAVHNTDVFARVSPEHKLRLVQALQAHQHIVAMTGDGVNDAPALKSADVGIAMGKKGTEVAKEASEIVLADDNFDTIAKAVEAGRAIHDNLKKAIIFILPTGIAEAMMVVIAIMSQNVLPITPVQILWVNMITEISLSLTLAFEPPEKNVMKRPPRKPDEPLLSLFLVWRIVFVSIIMVTGTYGLFLWEQSQSAQISVARTITLNTLVMFEAFYIFNSRYLLNSVLNLKGLFGNGYIWFAVFILALMQLALTYLPIMNHWFGTQPLKPETWLNIIAVSASVFVLVEIEKSIIRFMLPRLSKDQL